MIAMCLLKNLRTLLGTTSAATWTNLHQKYGVPHFTGIYKDYELAHSIRLTTGKNPDVQIQKIWTILECLWVNRCVTSNYQQDMLLSKAIPKEWDTIAQIYCNGMQMGNVTFDGVWDAIMAEWTCTAHPTQLQAAHNTDKIFAVKRNVTFLYLSLMRKMGYGSVFIFTSSTVHRTFHYMFYPLFH
jgi:hypothetical protein